jgi:hypothetical protein
MNSHAWFPRSLWSCAILAMTLALCAADVAPAGEKQGIFITQASARLTKLIDKANGDSYKLDDNSFSIGGGWLQQSTSKWVTLYTVTLQSGRSYRFLAAGDADAKDVDLEVLDSTGKTVASDTSTAPEASVDFRPDATQQYKVRVRLYASRENLPCVCLAVVLSK